MSARALSVFIVAIFIGSIMTSLTSDLNEKQQVELEDSEVIFEAQSPGTTCFYNTFRLIIATIVIRPVEAQNLLTI